jgi:hypothetical protein
VLAQLAVQSVFLYDQGVRDMKSLVDTAINIGRSYKNDVINRRVIRGGGYSQYPEEKD